MHYSQQLGMMVIAAVFALLSSPLQAVSLSQAVAGVKQRTEGRVVSAKTVRRDGGKVHQIRVLTNSGRVRLFRIDADSVEKKRGRR